MRSGSARGPRATPERRRGERTLAFLAGAIVAGAAALAVRSIGVSDPRPAAPAREAPAPLTAPAPLSAAQVPPPGAAGLDPTALEALIRDVVRDELRDAPGPWRERTADAARPGAARDPGTREPDPEAARAHADALDLVERARSSGRWTQESRVRLLAAFRHLGPVQRRGVLTALFSALNRGEIANEAASPL